jgi:hypothetical protein
MIGDALEQTREKLWAHKQAIKGLRRNTDGERHLCGLSVEESAFLIEYEARQALGLPLSRTEDDRYEQLRQRFEARRLGDYSRRIGYIGQHWRRSFRSRGI